jgi:hypothetical protein
MQWPRTESFTTALNVKAYALKPEVRKLLTVWDVTRRLYVPTIPRREWPEEGVDLSREAAVPWGIVFGATWPVKIQPVTTSTVTITSTSAGDGSGVSTFIEGLDASGDLVSESIPSNGLSGAVSATAFSFVTAVSKVGSWVGTMSMVYTVDSVNALTLSGTQYSKAYPTVEFVESPESGREFLYTFERTPRLLLNDNDIPHTPYPFSEIHVYDALLDMTTYNTELGGKEQGLWKDRYTELLDSLEASVDTMIVGSQPRLVRDLSESAISGRQLVSNF